MFCRDEYTADSDSFESSTILNELFTDENVMTRSPSIRVVFSREKMTPKSLFSHSSISILMTFSIIFPIAERTRLVRMSIRMNEMMFRILSFPSIYPASQVLKELENLNDSQTPVISEIMDMTWDMKPFRSPWMTAGTKHNKRMASNTFMINLS